MSILLEDKLKLEIRYVQEGRLIAITLAFAVSGMSAQARRKAYTKHCSTIRQFIQDQFKEAKCRGMKGLNLELRVQNSDTHTLDVLSENSMISLRGYPPQDGHYLVMKSHRPVDDSALVGLHYWYADITKDSVNAVDGRCDETWPSLDDKDTCQSVLLRQALASGGCWASALVCNGK